MAVLEPIEPYIEKYSILIQTRKIDNVANKIWGIQRLRNDYWTFLPSQKIHKACNLVTKNKLIVGNLIYNNHP